jgi:hypothetical protein
MIDRYVSFEFKEYRRIFRPTDEAGQLDNIGRRFAWFRRILGRHESELENDNENRRVFPGEWRVGWAMFAKFSEITRYFPFTAVCVSSHILNSEDLTVVLSKAGAGLTVQLLLDTLQQTIEFESSISRKYATPVKLFYSRFRDLLILSNSYRRFSNHLRLKILQDLVLQNQSHPRLNLTWGYSWMHKTSYLSNLGLFNRF